MSNLKQVMKQPRRFKNKYVHILLLLLAMILCVVMFFAQLLFDDDFIEENYDSFPGVDPEGYFASVWNITGTARVGDIKVVIFLATPITFLLSVVLILLFQKMTVLR